MGGSITWRGGAGAWAVARNWSGFILPGLGDVVTVGPGTAEIAAGVVAVAGALALPGGTLRVDAGGVLRTAGTIAAAGGTLFLAGTIAGGTLAPGGTIVGEGGTLDGTVVQGGFSGIGDVTITVATTAANAAHPIAADGTLTLAAGHYDGAIFRLDTASAGNGVVALDVATGRTVVLGASAQILGGEGATEPGAVAVLGGGTLVNRGTISLVPSLQPQTVTVYQPTGKFHSLVGTSLTYTEAIAPTLEVTAARFVNSEAMAVTGGTLEFYGATVRNTGTIRLADAAGQTLQHAADGTVSVVATMLATRVEIAASVSNFFNSGTIVADAVQFDGTVRLAALGSVSGAEDFAGTFELGGGAFAATAKNPVTISGTVQHGSLASASASMTLYGATLRGVTLASGTAEAAGTLHVVGLGGLTLDAGAALLAGGEVALAGRSGSAIVNSGTIAAATGATVSLQAGLAGNGTVELGGNAAVIVGALALFARPTFLFDAGASLLSLPGTGAGVTLANLHAGDVLDFRDISSIPATAGAQGSAYEAGAALAVIGASGQSALATLSAPAHGIGFAVRADGHGGTLVSVG